MVPPEKVLRRNGGAKSAKAFYFGLLCRCGRLNLAAKLLATAGAKHSIMETATLNPGEDVQLLQTIEMFEVIVQSQPNDCQSLEILKEAYSKLGRESDVINTSKRIAQAYVQTGQLSSAILEFETVLQRRPDDAEVQAALKEIEGRATNAGMPTETAEPAAAPEQPKAAAKTSLTMAAEIDDGRKAMYKIFVDSRTISAHDFNQCWRTADLTAAPTAAAEPFIQILQDKDILPVEKSLKLMSDKSRTAYLPLDKYDVDIELTRSFPADLCRRWGVLPFDRMSKAVLVATANPFNQQAVKELSQATQYRLVWYLVTPADLLANLRKAFR
jgi:tetratricopeptide (TPR) repeat protein